MDRSMMDLNIVGLCGSLRKDSLNRKLMHAVADRVGGTFHDADLNLPLYDGDVEAAGMPQSVVDLGARIASADALLIATPEYNKAPSGVLKNALDWVSRLSPNPMWNKPTAVMSATAGRAGGERAQTMLRAMLTPHRVDAVVFPELLVGGADGQFDADGKLVTESYISVCESLADALRAKIA